ncbi:hypothetical protein RPMD05_36 [Rhodobacteraceae phage LS06-2018-MD05]|nr:hypothetical protein RPMD05_36 [Rhodobacteraceae phage LS06-2018-MD05]
MKYKFEQLFNKHYEAIQKRGLITTLTKDYDFILKMDEELCEVADAKTKEERIKEAIDLMTVCSNFVIHNGGDLYQLLKENIEHQETRDSLINNIVEVEATIN